MELNHLRVFFEVAKVGSFTEAAAKLHISQSALSRSVALLEDAQGIQLFERSKRGVTLTPTGEEVFRQCENLFQTVNKIDEICRGIRQTCEGPLRFATTDHIANYLLIQPTQAFRNEFPLVVPSVFVGTPDEVISHLFNEEYEFGLLFAKVASPQIEYEGLREEPMALVVHADLWRENKAASQAATLQKVLSKVGYLSSIGVSKQSRPSRVLMELFGKMPQIGFEVSSQEAQKRICLARGGVAYLSRFMVEREIKNGELFEVNVGEPHAFKLWLATRRGRVLSLPANVFLDRLRAEWGSAR